MSGIFVGKTPLEVTHHYQKLHVLGFRPSSGNASYQFWRLHWIFCVILWEYPTYVFYSHAALFSLYFMVVVVRLVVFECRAVDLGIATTPRATFLFLPHSHHPSLILSLSPSFLRLAFFNSSVSFRSSLLSFSSLFIFLLSPLCLIFSLSLSFSSPPLILFSFFFYGLSSS